jgi:hypothetical protein
MNSHPSEYLVRASIAGCDWNAQVLGELYGLYEVLKSYCYLRFAEPAIQAGRMPFSLFAMRRR